MSTVEFAESVQAVPTAELLQELLVARRTVRLNEEILKDRVEKYLQARLGNGRQWVQAQMIVGVDGENLVLGYVPLALAERFSNAGLVIRKFSPEAHIIEVLIPVGELDGGSQRVESFVAEESCELVDQHELIIGLVSGLSRMRAEDEEDDEEVG